MQLYALYDETNNGAGVLAYLECFERSRSFFFELPPDADPWDLPFILYEFAQRGRLTVDATWSLRWVESRLVPPERQNLGEVLRENGLSEYDELRLLELTEGRCSQDGCYLVPTALEATPAWYRERVGARLLDAYALGGFRILASFRDGRTFVCPMVELLEGRRAFTRVMADEAVFARATLQADGHGVCWGSSLCVSSDELREVGQGLGLEAADIAAVSRQALCDVREAAELLGCSRQNISDLVRRGKLVPLKASPRSMLFLRADVLARR